MSAIMLCQPAVSGVLLRSHSSCRPRSLAKARRRAAVCGSLLQALRPLPDGRWSWSVSVKAIDFNSATGWGLDPSAGGFGSDQGDPCQTATFSESSAKEPLPRPSVTGRLSAEHHLDLVGAVLDQVDPGDAAFGCRQSRAVE